MDIISTLTGSVDTAILVKDSASTNNELLNLMLLPKEQAREEFIKIMADEIGDSNKKDSYDTLNSEIKFKLGILYLIIVDDTSFNLSFNEVIGLLRNLLLNQTDTILSNLKGYIDDNVGNNVSELYDDAHSLYHDPDSRYSQVPCGETDIEVYWDCDMYQAVEYALSNNRNAAGF